MKIVAASDSFKDSVTSPEVAAALKEGILEVSPQTDVACLAVGDGGEGTAAVLLESLGGIRQTCTVSDPLGRKIMASYGIVTPRDGIDSYRTALIEMAETSGLQLLKYEERNVMLTSSVGLGEMIRDAYERGCRNFMVGIGGSATCDAGTGLLSVLGFRFLNSRGEVLNPSGRMLTEIESIDDSHIDRNILNCRFTIICDVTNPLFGKDGAAYVYAPQKGASPEEVGVLDRGLVNIARIVKGQTGRDVASLPGAGAAGGIGWAFKSFFNAELKSGVDAVLDLIGFDSFIEDADLVITGEGRIDSQTLSGKVPYGVCRRAKKAGVPVVAVAGTVESVPELLKAGFDGVFPILTHPMTLAEALTPQVTAANLKTVGASLATFLQIRPKNIKP